jgi:hypothetical protein
VSTLSAMKAGSESQQAPHALLLGVGDISGETNLDGENVLPEAIGVSGSFLIKINAVAVS